MKNHSCNLHVPLYCIFRPNSVAVARRANHKFHHQKIASFVQNINNSYKNDIKTQLNMQNIQYCIDFVILLW
ncbi:DUF6783 domain-containing protein [Blautia sp.]